MNNVWVYTIFKHAHTHIYNVYTHTHIFVVFVYLFECFRVFAGALADERFGAISWQACDSCRQLGLAPQKSKDAIPVGWKVISYKPKKDRTVIYHHFSRIAHFYLFGVYYILYSWEWSETNWIFGNGLKSGIAKPFSRKGYDDGWNGKPIFIGDDLDVWFYYILLRKTHFSWRWFHSFLSKMDHDDGPRLAHL